MQNLTVLKTSELPMEDRSSDFTEVTYQNSPWNLSHLNSFGFFHPIDGIVSVLVIVVFSCHCFTRSATDEEISQNLISPGDWFDDGREKRVLDEERYRLSVKYLPQLIHELSQRRITIADNKRRNGNFVRLR